MSYRRDFTIGPRETRDFYLFLTLRRWGKGLLGFALAGALAAALYTADLPLARPAMAALAAAGALAGAGLAALILAISTCLKVNGRLRRSGRGSYVQETEINGFGVRVAVGKDRARLGFEDLAGVRETGRAFYLFLSASQAWILPKRQMEDPRAESEQLRAIFRAVVERGKLRVKK